MELRRRDQIQGKAKDKQMAKLTTVADVVRKVRRGGGSHTALEILKVMRRPMSLDELTHVSPKLLSTANRKSYLEHLRKYGMVTVDDSGKYSISALGVDVLYKIPLRDEKRRYPAAHDDD
jgi:predicted transcriptional regulator